MAVALAPALLERPASSELAALFRGLAEPARLAILRRLVDAGPQTVPPAPGGAGQIAYLLQNLRGQQSRRTAAGRVA